MRNLFIIILACCTCLACSEKDTAEPALSNKTTPAENRSIEAIADEYLAALLERHPEMGTNYSLPGARHDRLSDNSPQALTAWQSREDAW